MSNVRLTWQLPTPTARQRPVKHVLIESRIVADPPVSWTVLNTVVPPTTELLEQDVAPGSYEYRGTVVDDFDQRGPPLIGTVDVPFDPPAALSTFAAMLE